MNDPRVSVIVPVHNSEKYLGECLDSILAQTERNIEVICVDDGSTDSSPEILASYAQRDERLLILTQECRGAGAARNNGLSIARGTYLSFLDSDDFFEPEMLKAGADKLDETKADLVVFGSWIYDVNRRRDRRAPWHFKTELLPDCDPFSYRDVPDHIFNSFGNVVWNKLFRKSFVTEHELRFQEISHYNDQFFAAASLVLAKRITSVNQNYVHYRVELKTNLQSTNDRDPHAFLAPYQGLYELLASHELFEEVRSSFLNWVLDGVTYSMDTFRSSESFAEGLQTVRDYIEPAYHLLESDSSIFENAANLEQYRALLTLEPGDYLLKRIAQLRKTRDDLYWLNDWRAWRMDVLNQQTSQLEAEVRATRMSASYRLGHALFAPARAIKRALAPHNR